MTSSLSQGNHEKMQTAAKASYTDASIEDTDSVKELSHACFSALQVVWTHTPSQFCLTNLKSSACFKAVEEIALTLDFQLFANFLDQADRGISCRLVACI